MRGLLFLFLVFFAADGLAQNAPAPLAAPDPYSPGWYRQRARRQKVAAAVLLGSGLSLSVAGALMLQPDYRNIYQVQTPALRERRRARERTGGRLALGGLALAAGSIPLFFASARNERLVGVQVRRESSFLPDPAQRSSFPALALRLRL
ncbi:MAG: hypothetical protein EOO16_06885 [Chitinophagaceae bacterium]|nr:MAG: hypothetical protein EOO16_06885 [Chitinophagaceae bacterium]